MNFIVSSEQVW